MNGHIYIHTHIHTYTHDNYNNPRCAHAHREVITHYHSIYLLTLGAHAHSEGYSSSRVCMCVCVYVCVYVCVTTHNCRLAHWNHTTEIPTCSQQYSDRFKFCRFS